MLSAAIGNVVVHTTSGRGFTPEELATRAVNRIVSISDTADPIVQAQARAFRDQVFDVVLYYLQQAAQSERTTIRNKLQQAGFLELTALLND